MEKKEEKTPAKKLYLIRADDVRRFEFAPDDAAVITALHLIPGGRIVQIDDNPEGRGRLTSNIRRIVGDKATTRLLSGIVKPDKN